MMPQYRAVHSKHGAGPALVVGPLPATGAFQILHLPCLRWYAGLLARV
jgi:hypothetical protein